MIDCPLVFVDIDTQHDFLDPEGALFIAGSGVIRPNLARLSTFAHDHSIPVIATACAHTLDEPDPEPFPPHCLIGWPGQARIPETAASKTVVVRCNGEYNGELYEHLTIEKRRYDLFTNPAAERVFEVASQNDPTFVVYGVATDYCVKAAVLGLLERGHRVVVVVDAIRAVDPEQEPAVVDEFVQKGATLVMTEAVCG